MALILLKQTYTHTLPSGRDNFHQWFFDTVALDVEETDSRALELEEYEMATDQLIYSTGGDDYRYDGDGGFYIAGTPPVATWPLTLTANPPAGGTAVDLTATAPYETDEVISLQATPNPGYIFVNWTRNGAPISIAPAFNYTMTFGGASLVANFQAEAAPPTPTAIPDKFYPLEVRVNNAQIPIPTGLVQRIITGIFTSDMEGDRSFPVNIPMDPEMMIALGMPNDPQSNWDYSKPFPAELWAHGNRLYPGYLDILKADETQIRATFILDSAYFISQNKPLTLPKCYDSDEVISLANQPIIAIGGYQIRFNFDYDIRVTVNSSVRIFVKAEYEEHILMLEAVADWLDTLAIGLQVSIEYSEDLTDFTSKIIYWDTTTVTETTVEVYLPNRGEWTVYRYSRPKKLTSKRFEMEPWNQVLEQNRIAFPSVYNRELYEGNNSLHDGIVNRYDEAGRLFVSNQKYLTYAESFRWEHTIVPYLYLTDVVKRVFKKLGISVSGNFFEDDRVKRMLLYNNRTLDFVQVRLNDAPVRRTVANIQQGESRDEETEYADNYWYENIHDLEIKLSNHVPEVSVVEFLKAMKNYFCLKYDFNTIQNKVEIRFIKDIIRQRQVLDMTSKASKLFTITHNKSAGLAFKYENPDPLMSDGMLSEWTDERIYKDPDTGAFQIIADYTVQNYLALDALDAEIEEIAFVQSLRAYFILTPDQNNPPFWKLYAFIQQDDHSIQSEIEEDSTQTKSWSVGMFPLLDSYFSGRKMPAIECTGNNPEVNLSNKECGIRIFAFYGQQLDAADQPYAFASCTRYNAKEILSATQYDLDIRSEDSNPFWKDLDRIIDRGKQYECNLLLESSDFIKLSKTPIIRIANLDYLIDEFEVQHSTKEFSIAKTTLWKLK